MGDQEPDEDDECCDRPDIENRYSEDPGRQEETCLRRIQAGDQKEDSCQKSCDQQADYIVHFSLLLSFMMFARKIHAVHIFVFLIMLGKRFKFRVGLNGTASSFHKELFIK